MSEVGEPGTMYPSVLVGDMDPGSRASPLAGVTTEDMATGGAALQIVIPALSRDPFPSQRGARTKSERENVATP